MWPMYSVTYALLEGKKTLLDLYNIVTKALLLSKDERVFRRCNKLLIDPDDSEFR